MARYKHINTSPRFLAVDLERQLVPGTFEHALNQAKGVRDISLCDVSIILGMTNHSDPFG